PRAGRRGVADDHRPVHRLFGGEHEHRVSGGVVHVPGERDILAVGHALSGAGHRPGADADSRWVEIQCGTTLRVAFFTTRSVVPQYRKPDVLALAHFRGNDLFAARAHPVDAGARDRDRLRPALLLFVLMHDEGDEGQHEQADEKVKRQRVLFVPFDDVVVEIADLLAETHEAFAHGGRIIVDDVGHGRYFLRDAPGQDVAGGHGAELAVHR